MALPKMADDPLERAKLVLASFTPDEQRKLHDFLGRRLGKPEASLPKVVATVKTRRSTGGITYRQELVRCGKQGCRCEAAPCHGPYTYKYWREGGKLRKKYVGKRGYASASPATRPAAGSAEARAQSSSAASSSAPIPPP